MTRIKPIDKPSIFFRVKSITWFLTILTIVYKIDQNWSKNTENVNKNNGIPSIIHKNSNLD